MRSERSRWPGALPLQPGHLHRPYGPGRARPYRRLLGRAIRPNACSPPPSLVNAESCSSSPSSSRPEPITPGPRRRTSSPRPAEGWRVRRRLADRAEEGGDRPPRRRPVEPLERVEQVALRGASATAARTPRAARPSRGRACRRARAARPHWPGWSGKASSSSSSCSRWLRNASRLRAGGRVDAEALRLRAHRVPDLRCATPRASGRAASASALRAPQLGVGEVRCGVEEGGAPRPAPLLDAGDGDRQASLPASTRTVTLRMRFCLAPTSSSPS